MNKLLSIILMGGLAAFALNSMSGFTDKARFTEIMQMAGSMTKAITICGQVNNGFENCDNLEMGGRAGAGNVTDIEGIDVTNGVITVAFLHEETKHTYILTPTLNDGIVHWTVGGTCLDAGLCDATSN